MFSSFLFLMGSLSWAQDGTIQCKGNLLARAEQKLQAAQGEMNITLKGDVFSIIISTNGEGNISGGGNGNLRGSQEVKVTMIDSAEDQWNSTLQYIEGDDINFLFFNTKNKDKTVHVEGLFSCKGL